MNSEQNFKDIFTTDKPLTNLERVHNWHKKKLDADDFLEGQSDCKLGVAHRAGNSDSYDRGYAAQYEWTEILTAQQERSERR